MAHQLSSKSSPLVLSPSQPDHSRSTSSQASLVYFPLYSSSRLSTLTIHTHTQPCLKPLERPPSHTPVSGTSLMPSRESSDACPSESQRPSWESISRSTTPHVMSPSSLFLALLDLLHSRTREYRNWMKSTEHLSTTIKDHHRAYRTGSYHLFSSYYDTGPSYSTRRYFDPCP